MKNPSLFDTLILLIAKYICEGNDPEQAIIKTELLEAGITLAKLVKIARLLKELLHNAEEGSSQGVMRFFADDESEKMDANVRGCIQYLESTKALTAPLREWLIEQALALDVEEVGIEELQSLLSLAMFQRYGESNFGKQNKSLIITNPRTMH